MNLFALFREVADFQHGKQITTIGEDFLVIIAVG
jgi:hypothetical protein